MAVATQHSAKAASRHVPHSHPEPAQPRASRQRFVASLSVCLFNFVVQHLPTGEELAVKEDVRKLLERLIRTIEPDSRLLSFGSTANGFSLRNSDMDLCCLIDSEERLAPTDLVTMLGDLLERETKFQVKPLPHARIPIVKLSLDPSLALPHGIACDIGFENRLALENTRLLFCYAMIDPTRVRILVLFLKVWCKRRKINSPYEGTLSSYGYVLLVIYFLVHVKNPPVLPNLQQMPPMRPISHDDTHIGGYNTWFFDDIELLRQRWQSANTDSIGQLLIDFFKYFSRDFSYNTGVASIRAGLLKKESKGWQNDLDPARYKDARERNRFCIEDPFETGFNVARCVTREGLYAIRGEFMRASRILSTRPERAIYAIAQLCEERMDVPIPPTSPTAAFVPPRLSPFLPQTPYTVGSSPIRLTKIDVPDPTWHFRCATRIAFIKSSFRRARWTSPPPPSASSEDRSQFESQLGLGLALATFPTDARQTDGGDASSSNNSEILTDDGDDLHSIQSLSLSEAPESLPSSSSVPSPPLVPTQNATTHSLLSSVPGADVAPSTMSDIAPHGFCTDFAAAKFGTSITLGPTWSFVRWAQQQTVPTPHNGSDDSASSLASPATIASSTAHTLCPRAIHRASMLRPLRPQRRLQHVFDSLRHRQLRPRPIRNFVPATRIRTPSRRCTRDHPRRAEMRSLPVSPKASACRAPGRRQPSPPDSLSAGSDSPSPSSMSSQCDVGVDLVRWEDGGEVEGDATTAVASASGAEGAKSEESWKVMPKKVPLDALPQPTQEPQPR
ncbi:hypothetical protein F5148DRAFT_1368071 [Russula earlei]|uniref:Uncharacterized protein n=1 Tax=Russula earlei TaxID=71964 RepID=A0ACC0U8L9_9AGAM|nr:hypothetical protein F5148DRAFT_1368071 [Russula earlei]